MITTFLSFSYVSYTIEHHMYLYVVLFASLLFQSLTHFLESIAAVFILYTRHFQERLGMNKFLEAAGVMAALGVEIPKSKEGDAGLRGAATMKKQPSWI